MNKSRRNLLDSLIEQLERIQADLMLAHEEEQDYFDNMPEGIQSSEKGDTAQEAAEALSEAAEEIERALEHIVVARGDA